MEAQEPEEPDVAASSSNGIPVGVAVALDWSQVHYLSTGKLDIETWPVPTPFPDYEFKGYDISKDKSRVAAWFVRKGAMGPGTRRPQKGAGAGVNMPWHKQLQKARNMGAEQAFEFKKLSSDLYVPKWKRVKVEPNADAAPDESSDRSISPSLSI